MDPIEREAMEHEDAKDIMFERLCSSVELRLYADAPQMVAQWYEDTLSGRRTSIFGSHRDDALANTFGQMLYDMLMDKKNKKILDAVVSYCAEEGWGDE